MSVNWECGETEAHKVAAKAAKANTDDFDSDNEVWTDYYHLREAMIWAMLIVKFPDNSRWKITQKNWEEIYRRLAILEKVNGCYRVFCVPDKDDPTMPSMTEKREVFFTPEEVHSLIGMAVNAGNLTSAKFRTYIYKQMVVKEDIAINKFKEQLDVQDNDKG